MALHAEWEEYQMYEDSVWRYTLLGAYAGDPEARYQMADDYATESFNDHYDLDSAYYWAKSAYNQGHQAATSLYANCYIQDGV
jgi:TPR repeat protein